MPRVENLGPNVDAWYATANGDGSSTHDVCKPCGKKLEADPHRFNARLKPYQNNEPQGSLGWGDDVEHPSYDDDKYCCAACGVQLTDED